MNFTSKMSVVAALVVAVVVMAGQSRATETVRYRLSGDWMDVYVDPNDVDPNTDHGWGHANGTQTGHQTDPNTEARINWGGNTVTVTSAVAAGKVMLGVNEPGVVVVDNGGVLTAAQVNVGHNGAAGTMDIEAGGIVNNLGNFFTARVDATAEGYLNIFSGGVLNVDGHLWLGITGFSALDISGTLNQTDGILGLGTIDAVTPGGGSAEVTINDGGEMNLFNIHGGGTQSSIQPGSFIDILGSGRLTLPGDKVGSLQGYEDAGLILGEGLADNVDINLENLSLDGDFDSSGKVDGIDFLLWQTNPGVGDLADWELHYGESAGQQTVVTVTPLLSAISGVPEPAALTLVLMGAFVMGSSRRRRR
jgi:hypothetical protein